MSYSNKWKAFDFGHDTPSTRKKTKRSDSNGFSISEKQSDYRKKLSKNTNAENFNFEAKIAPKDVKDLAVHPKKLQEVQDCLLDMLSNKNTKHPQILLITGPTGSGKYTTLTVVCRDLGVGIQEWINPIEQDYEITHENQLSQFIDFLVGSKWSSLFESMDNHITVVKDFPNIVIRHPEKFHEVLEECWYKTKTIIVFICTEVNNKNVNLIKTLFPENIMQTFRIRQIDFNACAHTLMKTAIIRVQNLIKDHTSLFTQPSKTVVEAIIATSMGDIRNAMNQFYLSSLKGGGSVPLFKDKREIIGSKRKKKDNNKMYSMEKDETLGLFHGLGRVLNPKWVSEGNGKRLSCNLDKLIDEFSTQPLTFISFLFENYLKYFGDFTDAAKAANILSISAKFLENFIEHDEILVYGLWVSILGLMVCNEHKVSKWTQISGPVRIDKKSKTDQLGYDCFDRYYCDIIRNCDKDKLKVSEAVEYDSDELCIIDEDF